MVNGPLPNEGGAEAQAVHGRHKKSPIRSAAHARAERGAARMRAQQG
jgi:hypothetical protein